MARKTIEVDHIHKMVNNMLATSYGSYNDANIRIGALLVLENVLFATGNYKGFRYLDTSEIPSGEKPGINVAPDGSILEYEDRFADTDSSRVYYF